MHTIAPAIGWVPIRMGEIWEFRELLFFLVWREVKIRYKQTALGVAWAILQPVLTMVVFSVFFGRLGRIPSDGLPYPVFAFSALVPWQLFAFALAESSNSVVANQRLVTKVYFPRLIMPMAAVCVGLVDFCLSLIVLFEPDGLLRRAAVGGVVDAAALDAAGGRHGARRGRVALGAQRPVSRHPLHAAVSDADLARSPRRSPIPARWCPAAWRSLYALNPMVGVVDGFRWALLDGAPAPTLTVGVSCRRGRAVADRRAVLLPANGTHVRGRDLSP